MKIFELKTYLKERDDRFSTDGAKRRSDVIKL